MNSDTLWKLILFIICLFSSAIFSAAETALMSLSKIRIRQMVEDKEKGADRIDKLLSDPSKLLSAILIGNNVVNVGASALLTSLAIEYYGSNGVGIATFVMTLLILVFGEITPKSLAAQNSERISVKLSGFVNLITIILTPIIGVLTFITGFFIKIMGGDIDKTQPFITHEELKAVVNVSHKEGLLKGEEKTMIYNIFDFSDLQAKDVMVPRTDMIALDVESTYDEVLEVFKEEQYSRIPVYEENIDNIVGILNAKDLLFSEKDDEAFHLEKYLREADFTYEFKSIKKLFEEMRESKTHISIVLDEYGGTEGVVTIEDLIEEIVGEIEDEYDKEFHEIQVIKEDEYLVYGSVKIEIINELIGTNIESEDFDSIGGFIIGVLGDFPEEGEVVEYGNIKFIIEKVDRNKIEQIRITT